MKTRVQTKRLLFVLLLMVNAITQLAAQSSVADVTGSVLTEKGEILQGVTIIAKNRVHLAMNLFLQQPMKRVFLRSDNYR